MHTSWGGSDSYNRSELYTVQGSTVSRYLSSWLPFCVRFNRVIRLASQPATLDTTPLAKSYLGGSRSQSSSTQFDYKRICVGYVTCFRLASIAQTATITAVNSEIPEQTSGG